MKLTLFSFSLPLIIGYVLFIGISGKFWPFRKPAEEHQRPAWMLGLWAGFSVAIVLALMLNMAYRPSTTSLGAMILPSIALLATLLLPGFLAWFLYKRQVEKSLASDHDLSQVSIISQEIYEFNETTQNGDEYESMQESDSVSDEMLASDYVIDETVYRLDDESDEPDIDIENPVLEPTASASVETITSSESFNQAFWQARDQVISRPSEQIEADLDEVASNETDSSTSKIEGGSETTDRVTAHWIHPEQHPEEQLTLDLDTQPHNHLNQVSTQTGDVDETLPTAETETLESDSQLDFWFDQQPESLIAQDSPAELIGNNTTIGVSHDTGQQRQLMTEVKEELQEEQQKREHAETHLRITRKALVTLESKSRAEETQNLNQRIELEDRLADSIRQIAVSDARADREARARSALELELKESRRAILEAKQATSKNLAARAKALKTANKAIAFARQTIDARSKVESNARTLKETIESQQATIGSLINSLESEQAKALEEKSFLAKQLIRQEKQSPLPEVVEEESLASKLVQKVARSKSRA